MRVRVKVEVWEDVDKTVQAEYKGDTDLDGVKDILNSLDSVCIKNSVFGGVQNTRSL